MVVWGKWYIRRVALIMPCEFFHITFMWPTASFEFGSSECSYLHPHVMMALYIYWSIIQCNSINKYDTEWSSLQVEKYLIQYYPNLTFPWQDLIFANYMTIVVWGKWWIRRVALFMHSAFFSYPISVSYFLIWVWVLGMQLSASSCNDGFVYILIYHSVQFN